MRRLPLGKMNIVSFEFWIQMEIHLLVKILNVVNIVEHNAVIRFERCVDKFFWTIVGSSDVSGMGEDLMIHLVYARGVAFPGRRHMFCCCKFPMDPRSRHTSHEAKAAD